MIVFSFARPTCIQNVYDGFTFYCRKKTFAKYIISFYSKALLVQIQYMNPDKIKTKKQKKTKKLTCLASQTYFQFCHWSPHQ